MPHAVRDFSVDGTVVGAMVHDLYATLINRSMGEGEEIMKINIPLKFLQWRRMKGII